MPKVIPFPEDPLAEKYCLLKLIYNPPQSDIDLLQNLGVLVDYLDDFAAGKPYGAKIIKIFAIRKKHTGEKKGKPVIFIEPART